jgi:hypothetical protein
LGWSKKLIGCLILTAGLGNTSFWFSISAVWRRRFENSYFGRPTGLFLVLSTLGILVATIYSSGNNGFQIAKKDFPPITPLMNFWISQVVFNNR